jgi:hypothetical protein
METFAGITKPHKVSHSSGLRLFQKQHFKLMGQQCVQNMVLSLSASVILLSLFVCRKARK